MNSLSVSARNPPDFYPNVLQGSTPPSQRHNLPPTPGSKKRKHLDGFFQHLVVLFHEKITVYWEIIWFAQHLVKFNEKSYENQSFMLFCFMKNPMKTY